MGQKLVQYRFGMLSSLLFSFLSYALGIEVGGRGWSMDGHISHCFWTDGTDISHDRSPRIPVREVIFFPLSLLFSLTINRLETALLRKLCFFLIQQDPSIASYCSRF